MRRTTIKDIAQKCAISPTVASAALRNKKDGTVAYSLETRRNVLRVAKELGYRPNRLAQAMKSGVTPVVAVSLRIDCESEDVINLYLHDILPQAAMSLHKLGFEMLFLPYYEHEEQIKRLNELLEDRLIGGVVSNFIQGEEKKLIKFHKQTGIPLIILGKIESDIIPSISVSKRNINRGILDFANKKSYKKVYFVDFETSGDITFKQLKNENTLVSVSKNDISLKNALFVVNGEKHRKKLLREGNVIEDQILLIEDFRMPVHSKFVLLVQSKTGQRATLAAELISDWMKTGMTPTIKQHVIETAQEDYQIVTST